MFSDNAFCSLVGRTIGFSLLFQNRNFSVCWSVENQNKSIQLLYDALQRVFLLFIIQLLKTQHFSDISYQKSIVFETLNNFPQRSYFGFSDKIFFQYKILILLIADFVSTICQFIFQLSILLIGILCLYTLVRTTRLRLIFSSCNIKNLFT